MTNVKFILSQARINLFKKILIKSPVQNKMLQNYQYINKNLPFVSRFVLRLVSNKFGDKIQRHET